MCNVIPRVPKTDADSLVRRPCSTWLSGFALGCSCAPSCRPACAGLPGDCVAPWTTALPWQPWMQLARPAPVPFGWRRHSVLLLHGYATSPLPAPQSPLGTPLSLLHIGAQVSSLMACRQCDFEHRHHRARPVCTAWRPRAQQPAVCSSPGRRGELLAAVLLAGSVEAHACKERIPPFSK